jgi:DNA-binding response OmpR family regulator
MTDSLGRLLIVDDEGAVLEVLTEYFASQGYTVETATSGTEALEAVRRAPPDLVLLDIRMPGMDGIEVLRQLREMEPRLAVIMVTANEDVALARETLKMGAFDYVSKPFDFRYLDRAVAAGLVQAGPSRLAEAVAGGGSGGTEDPWRRLAFSVFRAARAMSPAGRLSTGERLEAAVLAAWRETVAGRSAAAGPHLSELELLLSIAAELGDLPLAARSSVETALTAVRKELAQG